MSGKPNKEMMQIETIETTRLAELETIIERGQQTFIEVGLALTEIREAKLYRQDFATFEEYCRTRWGWNSSRSRQLIQAAETVKQMETVTIVTLSEPLPIVQNEGQARELAKVENVEKRIEVWQMANEIAAENNQPVTAKIIHQVVNKPHVSHNSGNNEWYTPPAFVEAARTVLGEIDFDPASSQFANQTVKAAAFLTSDDDGLSFDWHGRVWMNPPYSGDLIGKFTQKLAMHFDDGSVTEAICLVNNATETNWFQSLSNFTAAVCFVNKRIRYLDSNGKPANSPLQGQVICYLGKNREKFERIFSQFGKVFYGSV